MIPRFRRHLLRVRCTAHFRIFCPLPCMNIQQSKRPGPPTASRRAPPSSAEGGKSFLVAECSIRILLGESGPSPFSSDLTQFCQLFTSISSALYFLFSVLQLLPQNPCPLSTQPRVYPKPAGLVHSPHPVSVGHHRLAVKFHNIRRQIKIKILSLHSLKIVMMERHGEVVLYQPAHEQHLQRERIKSGLSCQVFLDNCHRRQEVPGQVL